MAQLFLLPKSPPRIPPLVYPFGASPGVNANHPAGKNIVFSAYAANADMYSLLQGGLRGTLSGAPTGAIKSVLGPVVNFGASSIYLQFGGNTTAVIVNFTVAAIFQITTVNAALNGIFQSSTSSGGGGGVYLTGSTVGGNAQLAAGFYLGTTFQSGFNLTTNTPYFGVASVLNTGGTNYTVQFLAKNLLTGKIQVATITGTSATANGGGATYNVGGLAGANFSLNGFLAAVAFTSFPISAAAQQAWADDPWGFWYPRYPYFYVGAAAAATRRLRTIMGVGQ